MIGANSTNETSTIEQKKPHSTALVSHVTRINPPHEFNFAEKSILKKVRHRGMLKIHEVNQIIINEEKAVNFKTDAEHVTPVLYNLIKREGKREIKQRHLKPSTTSLYKHTTPSR